MRKLHVFLADDHAIVRAGLRCLINAEADMEVIGEASEGGGACEQILRQPPDVLILEVSMPGWNGVQAAASLKQQCPHVRILAFTGPENRTSLRQMLQAGAAGFVLKRTTAEELLRAIRTVAAGNTYLDPALTCPIPGGSDGQQAERRTNGDGHLSVRETEVVRLIAAGHSNKEIASQLELSIKTVETYKARSMEKLDLHSRADLVRYALRRGWLHDA